MIQSVYEVTTNERIAQDVYRMQLAGDTSAIVRPGQFVNIKLEGFYLRRPISVCDREEGLVTIIYKAVGEGTRAMAKLPVGSKLDVLTGLGNGFDMSKAGARPLLIGGGVGTPPMYGLCRQLVEQGARPAVILGFASACDVFYLDEFEALGVTPIVCTVDGSMGIRGFVTHALAQVPDATYFYACGPEAMLKAVYDATDLDGQLSFERRMGCGFGACMGCSCKTKYGNKRICKDGPVLQKEEIVW